ncbi:MAG: tryptophan synthase subunit alpha [Sulfurovaceae bacterium]|nr:tryptophan synthase subunit alpha [Sulfurovaceae bacterium]
MKKLVAYITTGFPSLEFTVDASHALKEAGVDSLELGVPFSDPVADGPVIEQANLLSLRNGFKISQLFDVSRQIAPVIDTLWMGYFNSFYHKGFDTFIKEAKQSGVSGFIIPDLPYEEAVTYQKQMRDNGMTLIDFIAPTDTPERIAMITANAQKFIYLVAYAGITGSGKAESLDSVISEIRKYSNTPIYVGFGVDENTAKEKVKGVDGVIVGSALVKVLLDEHLNNNEKLAKIGQIAKAIKEKINE